MHGTLQTASVDLQPAYGYDLPVFPRGGLGGLYSDTRWLVQAHNRWWDPTTVYAAQNGGEFPFEVGGFTIEGVWVDE